MNRDDKKYGKGVKISHKENITANQNYNRR